MSRSWHLTLGALAVAAVAGPSLDVPFFRQQKNGCGAASVAMVMHYWAKRAASSTAVPSAEQTYQRLYDTRRKGILLADMRNYLQEHGFHAFTLRGQWNDVERHLALGRPIIVALKPGRTKAMHFAVVVGLDGDHVWLNDPTKRTARRLKRTDFETQWGFADRWVLLATPA